MTGRCSLVVTGREVTSVDRESSATPRLTMRMAPTTVLPYVRYWPLIARPSDCLDQPNAAAVNRARRASESFPPIGATIGLFPYH